MTGNALDPQRWQRLAELFDRALELDAAGREALLADTGDETLRSELQRMLAADAASGRLDTADAAVVGAQVEQLLHAADPEATLIGHRIGCWRIESLLGSGGMGRVFLASRVDGEFEQRVALKLLGAGFADDLTRRRFLEERRVLAKLAHPRIARLLDGGLGPDGEPWYAMEYVDGAPLTEWCDARKLPLSARLDLFRKVCEAVDFAHRHLVIHRDLKPANILVDAEGEPKLLDFGIAKLLPAADAQTRSDTRMMTPEYAAPEQLRNEAVSTATDVYALGAILFELLTGKRAFADPLGSREPPSALRACPITDSRAAERAATRATTPHHLRKALRGDLERILRGALEPDPARRYRSAGALAADLHRHLRGQPISLRRDRGYRFGKFVRRHRFGAAVGTVAALALIATSAFALWQAQTARAQAQRADAVKDFMIGVFASADPSQHPGTGPSARALLDAGARSMQQRFGNDPEVEGDLSRALARSYAGIGAFDSARALAAQALRTSIALHGDGSPQATDARIDYAEILQASGLQRDAQQQAQIVLREARADDPQSAVRAHLVNAAADNELMRDAQAQAEAEQALKLAGTRTSTHWRAEAWNDLAQVYLGRGQFDQAQSALREAISAYERTPGENPTRVIDARTNLIFLLLHTGHQPQALKMYASLGADERRVLGPAHPALAQTLAEYAYMLWSTGNYAQSRQTLQQAQDALASVTDMSPMLRSASEINMAIVARLRGDLPRALHLLDHVDQINAPLGRDAQRYTLSAHWLRAGIDAERGNADAIAELDALREESQRRHFALHFKELMDWPLAWLALGQPQLALQRCAELATRPGSARTRDAERPVLLLQRGIALVQLGRYDEAKTMLAQAQGAFAGKPENGANFITAQLWQGWAEARAGRPQIGLHDIETALAWRQRELGNDSYLTAEARLAHAEALAGLRRAEEALREQALSRSVLDVALAPTHVLRQRADAPLPR